MGRGTWDVGTRGSDKQTTPPDFCAKFVKYNFRRFRERCFLSFFSARKWTEVNKSCNLICSAR